MGIRFVRVPHPFISRSLVEYTDVEGDKMHPSRSDRAIRKMKMTPFKNIGKIGGNLYEGVMIAGDRPCMLMLAKDGRANPEIFLSGIDSSDKTFSSLPASSKNIIRVHPILADKSIKSFCELNNINSEHGFAYLTKNVFLI